MSILTITELTRRIQRFQQILPRNIGTNKSWTEVDICRVIVKYCTKREFNPAVPHDKIDLLHLLRKQYYTDLEIAASAKAAKLKEQQEYNTTGQKLINTGIVSFN